jgi:hypothetical protein
VQHWAHEVNKFIDRSALRPVGYSGAPFERSQQQVGKLDCVKYSRVQGLSNPWI